MTDSERTERVEVTQADREAAAEWCAAQPFPSKQFEAPMIAAGEYDHHSLVQAFARHRIAALRPAPVDGLVDFIAMLAANATPGPWGIWLEDIGGKADKAIQELIDQVHNTDPIGNSLVMLDADGKCPAITGCGPTSAANASLIVELVNNLPTILTALRAQEAG